MQSMAMRKQGSTVNTPLKTSSSLMGLVDLCCCAESRALGQDAHGMSIMQRRQAPLTNVRLDSARDLKCYKRMCRTATEQA